MVISFCNKIYSHGLHVGMDKKCAADTRIPKMPLTAPAVCVCTFAATFCCGSPHPAIRRGPPHGCAHLGGSKLTAGGRNTSHHPKLLIQILYSPFSLPCLLPFSSPRPAGEPPPQLRLAVDAVGRRGRRYSSTL